MSWNIQKHNEGAVVTLEGEIGIHSASDFYKEILALASMGGSVGINAVSAGCLHTSIMQILYSLSKAVPEFGVVSDASPGFIASETRVGMQFPRKVKPVTVKAVKKSKPSKKTPKPA